MNDTHAMQPPAGPFDEPLPLPTQRQANWRVPPIGHLVPRWEALALHDALRGRVRGLGEASAWTQIATAMAAVGLSAARMGAPAGDVTLAAFIAFDTLLMELTPAGYGRAWAENYQARMLNAIADMDLRDQIAQGQG